MIQQSQMESLVAFIEVKMSQQKFDLSAFVAKEEKNLTPWQIVKTMKENRIPLNSFFDEKLKQVNNEDSNLDLESLKKDFDKRLGKEIEARYPNLYRGLSIYCRSSTRAPQEHREFDTVSRKSNPVV